MEQVSEDNQSLDDMIKAVRSFAVSLEEYLKNNNFAQAREILRTLHLQNRQLYRKAKQEKNEEVKFLAQEIAAEIERVKENIENPDECQPYVGIIISKTEPRDTRRGLLKTAATTTFSFSILGRIRNAFGRPHLKIQYVKYNNKLALQVPVRRGMSYALLAGYVTGKEGNWPQVEKFNGRKALSPGDSIFIPIELLTKELRAILDENKFQRFTIDEEGGSLAALMETNVDYTKYGYNTTLNLLLVINDDVNLADPIFQPGSPVILPTSLLRKDLIFEDIEDRKPRDQIKKNEVPKVKKDRRRLQDQQLINLMTTYQNSFRLPASRVLSTLRRRDKFGARRVRSGGRISAKGHQGLDLPCKIGTRLFPLGVGRVTLIRDYRGTSYWRNGKAVEVKLAYGYVIKYIHLKKFRRGLRIGDVVNFDTIIGYAGISGNASRNNPHVHIQATYNGRVIDPLPFIYPNSVEGKKLRAQFKASVQRNRNLYLKLFKKVQEKAL